MYSIGIDEAGRGALAGPVVVAAVAVPKFFDHKKAKLPRLKDSKQLSHPQRELWQEFMKEHPLVFYTTARVYQGRIDQINISKSANWAASSAFERLFQRLDLELDSVDILLDGSLYLGKREHAELPAKTIIRGDETRVPIKLASIIAKVTRDRYMEKLAQRYPEYLLDEHKGYGTKAHFKAIEKHGVLDIHRLTYLSGYSNLKPR